MKKAYFIDVQGLFECSSRLNLFTSPMPNQPLDVNIVQWAVEMTYESSLLGVKILAPTTTFL
jgi:hypothetical protein